MAWAEDSVAREREDLSVYCFNRLLPVMDRSTHGACKERVAYDGYWLAQAVNDVGATSGRVP